MVITSKEIATFVDRIHANMEPMEKKLNQADSELGDGDTGGMLRRFVDALSNEEIRQDEDIGNAFLKLAKAGAGSTGSSFGTLLATGLMGMGKNLQGCGGIDVNALSTTLGHARKAMMKRGGTELGAKTAIDSIFYVESALATAETPCEAAEKALRAAEAAMSDFRDRPCKKGRARMFSEKSIGLDDPGMLAILEIAKAVATIRDEQNSRGV